MSNTSASWPFVPNGYNMQCGLITTPEGPQGEWTKVRFASEFNGDTIIVLPYVQTCNGKDTPNLRIRNVTKSGFEYSMMEIRGTSVSLTNPGEDPVNYQKLYTSDWHYQETFGYVAFCVDCPSE